MELLGRYHGVIAVCAIVIAGCGRETAQLSAPVMTETSHRHFHVHRAGVVHDHVHTVEFAGGHEHAHQHAR